MGNLMIGSVYPPSLGAVDRVYCGVELCWPAKPKSLPIRVIVNEVNADGAVIGVIARKDLDVAIEEAKSYSFGELNYWKLTCTPSVYGIASVLSFKVADTYEFRGAVSDNPTYVDVYNESTVYLNNAFIADRETADRVIITFSVRRYPRLKFVIQEYDHHDSFVRIAVDKEIAIKTEMKDIIVGDWTFQIAKLTSGGAQIGWYVTPYYNRQNIKQYDLDAVDVPSPIYLAQPGYEAADSHIVIPLSYTEPTAIQTVTWKAIEAYGFNLFWNYDMDLIKGKRTENPRVFIHDQLRGSGDLIKSMKYQCTDDGIIITTNQAGLWTSTYKPTGAYPVETILMSMKPLYGPFTYFGLGDTRVLDDYSLFIDWDIFPQFVSWNVDVGLSVNEMIKENPDANYVTLEIHDIDHGDGRIFDTRLLPADYPYTHYIGPGQTDTVDQEVYNGKLVVRCTYTGSGIDEYIAQFSTFDYRSGSMVEIAYTPILIRRVNGVWLWNESLTLEAYA